MDNNISRANLQLPYEQENWKIWLQELFKAQIGIETKAQKIITTNPNAVSIDRFAFIKLSDDKNIAVLDIKTSANIQIARNRVALRDIAVNFIDQYRYHGLLVFYHSEDEKQNDYRLSFISVESTMDDDGNHITQSTNAKRYSFVLGKNETCATATTRLLELKNKIPAFKPFENQKVICIADITDAFSVEKLNKEFFQKYKDTHYKRFWEYIAQKPEYANVLLNKEETELVKQQKPIRDFVKKMLGRIVFLHFLQKKGWMGVPIIINDKSKIDNQWTGGDKNFMINFFDNFPDKNEFYSSGLSILFFGTLNTDRRNNNDIIPKQLLYTNTNTKADTYKAPFLNGGLFDDDLPQTNSFNFPTEYFAALFDFFNQYNFTIDENSPEEQEVGIDPEMLGHIFENLLEENKDKGAFYTPKEIVHYMCQESLIQYLLTQLSVVDDKLLKTDAEKTTIKTAIETFIRKDDIGDRTDKNNFIVANATLIENILDNVKICDPAIGSGAFPMGMLQEIFKAKTTLDLTLDKAQVKKDIIRNNIYGVDIEKGAVDIARLRFWLSLVVDEDVPQPLPNLDYKIMQGNSLLESFGQIDLSNILEEENNEPTIYAHNEQVKLFIAEKQSLMVFDKITKDELQEIINLYFDFDEKDNKKYKTKQEVKQAINTIIEGKLKAHFFLEKKKFEKQKSEIESQINSNIIKSEDNKGLVDRKTKNIEKLHKQLCDIDYKINHLTDILNKLRQWENENKERPYFLWHTYFKDVFAQGGFDIVIGNPPYIQLRKEGGKLAQLYENCGYKTFERTGDIYSLFYEKGNEILRNQGILCYITSNKWMRAGYGLSTRNYILQNTQPHLLIDLGSGIFDEATVDTNILILKKQKYTSPFNAIDISREKKITNIVSFHNTMVQMNPAEDESWTIQTPLEQSIKQKIERIGKPLKDWDVNIYRGILTGYNEAFIIDGKKKEELIAQDPKSAEIIKPILRGRDIKRYKAEFADLWLIATFPVLKLDIDNYPAVKTYLQSFGKKIHQTGEEFIDSKGQKQKTRKKTGNKWFETQDQIGYYKEFEKEKIVWAEMTNINAFVIDKDRTLVNQTCYFISNPPSHFISFLNSKLTYYYFSKIAASLGEGAFRWIKQYVENIPIPVISEQAPFIKLVDAIILKKESGENSSAEEAEIDALIYKLYDLSPEEIDVIDNS